MNDRLGPCTRPVLAALWLAAHGCLVACGAHDGAVDSQNQQRPDGMIASDAGAVIEEPLAGPAGPLDGPRPGPAPAQPLMPPDPAPGPPLPRDAGTEGEVVADAGEPTATPPSNDADAGVLFDPTEPFPPFADAGASPGPSPSPVGGDAGAGQAPPRYDIELVFEDPAQVSDFVRDAFEAARQRWEQVITNDLPDVRLMGSIECNGHQVPEFVDDLVIFVRIRNIDGLSGVLGSAAPCLLRQRDSRLPFAGAMEFDAVDLENPPAVDRLEEIILHEMGHVLGFGALWANRGLLVDISSTEAELDTAFVGEAALSAFDEIGGIDYQEGAKVPVENRGGDGVINGHWRERILIDELMTSRLDAAPARLSVVSLASLADLGYAVDPTAADSYSWPSLGFNARSSGAIDPRRLHPIDLRDDRLLIPLYELDETGQPRLVAPID